MGSPWGSISAKTSMSTLDGNWRMLVGRRTSMGSRHMLGLGTWARGNGSQQGENKWLHRASAVIWGHPTNLTPPNQERGQQQQYLAGAFFLCLEKSPYFMAQKPMLKASPYNGQRFLSNRTITFTNWFCLNFCSLVCFFFFFFYPGNVV